MPTDVPPTNDTLVSFASLCLPSPTILHIHRWINTWLSNQGSSVVDAFSSLFFLSIVEKEIINCGVGNKFFLHVHLV